MYKLSVFLLLFITVSAKTNPDENIGLNIDHLFEGDIVLTAEQENILRSPLDFRKAIGDLAARWHSKIIPYKISDSSAPDRDIIYAGIQHWEEHTCIRFTEDFTENPTYSHLNFIKAGGCWSAVGQLDQAGQDISIGEGCNSMGIVAHEIGHSVGFWHEQARPERDEFVKVFSDNISPDTLFNFDINPYINNYSVPYDLSSIMHYDKSAFSINGKATLVPRDITKLFEPGQRSGFSFADRKLANIMYNCSDDCAVKPLCQNSGYVDKYCQCQCPPEFSGTLCETSVAMPESCGGTFYDAGIISSPGYPNPYKKGERCIWRFVAPAGKRVRVYFEDFDMIERNDAGNCVWDWFDIRSSSETVDEGFVYCDQELNRKAIASDDEEIGLIFVTNYDHRGLRGFKANIEFV